MGRVSDHLKGFHKSAMERCDTVSKFVGKLANMSKAAKSDLKPDDDEDGICGTLQKIADAFADGASYHKSAMMECEKSMDAEFTKAAPADFEKRLTHLEGQIVPTRVSAVIPDRPGVRAVPRAGQPAFSEKPNVPVQFEKLVAIEE
jgi:hypothetical protein